MPSNFVRLRFFAFAFDKGNDLIPRYGLMIDHDCVRERSVLWINSFVSGRANPRPFVCAAIAVFIPIMSPLIVRRGHHEFPGCSALSVWYIPI